MCVILYDCEINILYKFKAITPVIATSPPQYAGPENKRTIFLLTSKEMEVENESFIILKEYLCSSHAGRNTQRHGHLHL